MKIYIFLNCNTMQSSTQFQKNMVLPWYHEYGESLFLIKTVNHMVSYPIRTKSTLSHSHFNRNLEKHAVCIRVTD